MTTVPDAPGNERSPLPASGRPDRAAHQSRADKVRTLRFNWARLVGYDFFISFKLGTFDEGGAQSYASDLARRLHERDFKVFFSEEEASLGEELDGTIARWLRRSRVLIVIANDGALTRSKWVRKEVETFCAHRPRNAVAVINVEQAIERGEAAGVDVAWLDCHKRIFENESAARTASCGSGTPARERRSSASRDIARPCSFSSSAATAGALPPRATMRLRRCGM